MIETATGIILRTRPRTETSLVVEWLTAHPGRVSTVAKGARRPKSTFHGKLDLFYQAQFSFQRSRRSDLHNLREVSLTATASGIRTDITRLQQAAYCAALIEQNTEFDTPLPEIFNLFGSFVEFIEAHHAKPRNIFAFELKLLRILGLAPDFAGRNLPPATHKLVTALAEHSWSANASLSATSQQARALDQFLHGFLIFHLGRIPPGRAAALEMP